MAAAAGGGFAEGWRHRCLYAPARATPASATAGTRGRVCFHALPECWLLFLLAALTVILSVLLPAGPASAAPPSAAQVRVRVLLPAAPVVVGVQECITAGPFGVCGPAQPQVASGDFVATQAASCSVNSFTADTPVLLADGTSKPIDLVKVGDQVQATDPQTGEDGARPVNQLIRHAGPHTMVDLTLADGSVLHSTDRHPIWDATDRTFTYAIDLHPGEQLRRPDGTLLTLAAVTVRQQTLTAYNLTIAGIHTYYAGTTPLLVHNSCGDDVAGLQHSLDAHTPGGSGYKAGKSVWEPGTSMSTVSKLADATQGQTGRYSAQHGTVQYVIRTGRLVGSSRGAATTTYTVARDPFDSAVVTMFPGR